MSHQFDEGNDVARAIASQRSFVGAALAVFVLYWICYVPGLLFNLMWLREAGQIRKLTGREPAGYGCLLLMFLVGIFPLACFAIVITTLFAGGAIGGAAQSAGTDGSKSVTKPVSSGPAPKVSDSIVVESTPKPSVSETKDAGSSAGQTAEVDELAELKAKKSAAEDACTSGTTYCVQSAKLSQGELYLHQMKLELTIFNGTNRPVSQAAYECTLYSDSRTIPYAKPSFSHDILGGLEPGETKTLHLEVNAFTSEWRDALSVISDSSNDWKFDISPRSIKDENGSDIPFVTFSQEDARKLRSLSRRVPPP